ncbi:MAG: hypothetical protein IJU92_04630 [Spirochaetaceae bacterium]|nr:hypothetical protein [Spirochaetaceae bacterium]
MKFKYIVKKELYELIHNPKSFLNIIAFLLLPFHPGLQNSQYKKFATLLSIMCASGQYIYDSYCNDALSGGSVFLENTKTPFSIALTVKLAHSLVICLFVLAIHYTINHLDILPSDLLSIVFLCIFLASLMQIVSVFLKNAEIISAIIVMTISALVLWITLIFHPVMQILLSLSIAITSILIAYRLSNSTYYRAQL